MNETCTPAPVELLNDMAQEIIDRLAAVNCMASIIEDRMYGSPPQQQCETKNAPACLEARLRCIRSQVKEIGDTLESVQAKV